MVTVTVSSHHPVTHCFPLTAPHTVFYSFIPWHIHPASTHNTENTLKYSIQGEERIGISCKTSHHSNIKSMTYPLHQKAFFKNWAFLHVHGCWFLLLWQTAECFIARSELRHHSTTPHTPQGRSAGSAPPIHAAP